MWLSHVPGDPQVQVGGERAMLPRGQELTGAGQGSELSAGGAAHLAKGDSRLLEPSNLQPFLEEVQGVRKGLADDSCSTATQQVFEVS